ncbi:D-beta-hydroxybutyrate permease [Streptococcus pyogenes]|nr:D-beta-hydroxybutyrate permease [Streptococcus pyogenes]
MEIIGSLGVLVGVIVIIYLSVKEVNIIIAAPLATSLVILFNQMDPTKTLLGKEPNQFMGALHLHSQLFCYLFIRFYLSQINGNKRCNHFYCRLYFKKSWS